MMKHKIRESMREIIPLRDDILLYELVAVILYVGKDDMWNIAISTKLRSKNWNELSYLIFECTHNKDKALNKVLDEILDDIGRKMSFDMAIKSIELLLKFSEEELMDFFGDYSDLIYTGANIYCANIAVVNNLVVALLKLYKGKTLLNTLCGVGNFLLKASNEKLAKEYVGIEAEKTVSDIAYLRSAIFDKNISIQFNSLFNIQERKYDMIYTTYPLKLSYDLQEIAPQFYALPFAINIPLKKYSSCMLNLLFMIEQLSSEGILIALIPEGGVFNSVDRNIREYIVNYNYLDAVISLPNNILRPYVGIKTSLLILKANRKPEDKIKMIDATEFGSMSIKKFGLTEKEIAEIVSLYSNEEENICKAIVGREEIAKEDYYLGVQRYVEQGGILIDGTELGKMCQTIFRGYQIKAQDLDKIITDDEKETDYRIINIADILPEGYVNETLTPVMIDDPSRVQKFCLEDGDIVITAKNTTIKSAVYEQKDGIKAILSGNLIAIRVNKAVLNPYYLKVFLDSAVGKQALSSIQTGTSIKTITPKNLEKMEISALPMDYQETLSKAYRERQNEVKKILNRYVQLMDEMENLYDESITIEP